MKIINTRIDAQVALKDIGIGAVFDFDNTTYMRAVYPDGCTQIEGAILVVDLNAGRTKELGYKTKVIPLKDAVLMTNWSE